MKLEKQPTYPTERFYLLSEVQTKTTVVSRQEEPPAGAKCLYIYVLWHYTQESGESVATRVRALIQQGRETLPSAELIVLVEVLLPPTDSSAKDYDDSGAATSTATVSASAGDWIGAEVTGQLDDCRRQILRASADPAPEVVFGLCDSGGGAPALAKLAETVDGLSDFSSLLSAQLACLSDSTDAWLGFGAAHVRADNSVTQALYYDRTALESQLARLKATRLRLKAPASPVLARHSSNVNLVMMVLLMIIVLLITIFAMWKAT